MQTNTLQDLLIRANALYGEKTFLKEIEKKEIVETSFKTLEENSRKIASFLQNKTNGEKCNAAIIGATSSAYLTCYFGTACSGNVIIPLDAQLGIDDLCDHLQRSDASVLFCDKKYVTMISRIKSDCPQIHTIIVLQKTDIENNENIEFFSDILEKTDPIDWQTVSSDECAAIIYTSGTTGKSKGVMLSHGNLMDNTMCEENESTPEDSLLTVLPIHHVYCFTCDILLSLRYGTTVCVNDSMMHIAQNLARFQPTMILLVPMIAETIYKKIKATLNAKPELSLKAISKAVFGANLKGIYSGGAYLHPSLIAAYKEMGIPIAQGYGMTECSPRIATAHLDDESVGDVGTIVNGCQVKIVDGEIWAKSPSVMMGYYKNPQATAESLTPDGWLRTGDLGYVDESNHLFLTGRKKNLIILSNGENISPEELENKFAAQDWVGEVLVYAEDGQITAELFPAQDFLASTDISDVEELFRKHVDSINRTVPPAKAIRRLRVRQVEFDKTPSRKIKRQQTEKGEII
jgi:long-chain acyl-CoA synthetase